MQANYFKNSICHLSNSPAFHVSFFILIFTLHFILSEKPLQNSPPNSYKKISISLIFYKFQTAILNCDSDSKTIDLRPAYAEAATRRQALDLRREMARDYKKICDSDIRP
jgi:hypothetical protein